MTSTIAQHDDGTGALALVRVHEPDPTRDSRVRARCRASLEKRRRRAFSAYRPVWHRRLEPAVVGILCAGYLFEVLSRAVLLFRF